MVSNIGLNIYLFTFIYIKSDGNNSKKVLIQLMYQLVLFRIENQAPRAHMLTMDLVKCQNVYVLHISSDPKSHN